MQDVGNQILHSDVYKKAIEEKSRSPGRFLSVSAGEYMSGLPANWTSPRPVVLDVKTVKAQFHADVKAGL